MKQSEFAALHGVSRKTVTTWKQRGWLVFDGDQVDVEASNEMLRKYRRDAGEVVTQPVTPAPEGNKSDEVTVRSGESIEQAAFRALVSDKTVMTLDEARLLKEKYLGLLNQLEYDKESGMVVEVSEVTTAVGAEYAKVRTRLLAIPAEQAPRLHRLKTVVEVQDALQEIIVEALEELTRDGASIA
jgi:phage terminase Nu1 subunit (DNA packaging protein)